MVLSAYGLVNGRSHQKCGLRLLCYVPYTTSMERELSVTITTSTLVKAGLLLLAGWLVYTLFDVVLIVLTAIVIASGIDPAAKWFVRHKVPRTLAILIVYILMLLAIFGVLYVFVPVFLADAATFLATLPTYFEFLSHLPGEYSPILAAAGADPAQSVSSLVSTMKSLLAEFSGDTIGTATAVFGGLLSFIMILVFSFYFAIQERGIEDFLRVVTPKEHEPYVLDLWDRSKKKIGLWLQGQLLLGVIVGVLVFLLLSILGVKHALVLAVVAAAFELIPVFGPTLAAAPAVMVAFVDGGVTLGLLVIGAYVIIQQFENHLIYPLVVTKVVGVPPLLVILALIVGGKLAGFLGIVLSAPVAAILQEVFNDIEVSRRSARG